MPTCNRPTSTDVSDLRTPAEQFNAQAAENEADDYDYLADQLDSWAQDLEDAYRLGLSDEAAGLHNTLSNLAGKLRKKADTAREGW